MFFFLNPSLFCTSSDSSPAFYSHCFLTAVKHLSTTQFDITRADGQFRKPASNKRLLTLISQTGNDEEKFEFTPFDTALDRTVKWFVENYERARVGKERA